MKMPFHLVNSIYLDVVDQINKENEGGKDSGRGYGGAPSPESYLNKAKSMMPSHLSNMKLPNMPSFSMPSGVKI
jgi:hypothetical protein